jgi:hypothetical protein
VCCLFNADTHRNSSREIKANTNSTLILTLALTLENKEITRKERDLKQKLRMTSDPDYASEFKKKELESKQKYRAKKKTNNIQ